MFLKNLLVKSNLEFAVTERFSLLSFSCIKLKSNLLKIGNSIKNRHVLILKCLHIAQRCQMR